MPAQVTPAMRKAAPDLCRQIDKLREERKRCVERRCYWHSVGKEEDAAEVQERITEIEAEFATLHAQAKEQLITGIANDLSQEATLLQVATLDAKTIRGSMSEENQRHNEAMLKLIAQQEELDGAFIGACNAMEGAAEKLTDGDKEQATEPGASDAVGESNTTPAGSSTDTKKSSPAGSSTDTPCPRCSKNCSGAKG